MHSQFVVDGKISLHVIEGEAIDAPCFVEPERQVELVPLAAIDDLLAMA